MVTEGEKESMFGAGRDEKKGSEGYCGPFQAQRCKKVGCLVKEGKA